MKRFCQILFVSLFFASNSHALLWLEPYIGYGTGGFELTLSNLGIYGITDGKYEVDTSGPLYGAKIGASVFLFAFGLQYETGSIKEKMASFPAGSVANTATDEYDTTHLGAFVTFTGAPLINVWANYFFDVKYEETKGDIGDELTGTGYGLGLGFTGLPFVSLNLEYRKSTIDEEKDVSTATTTKLPSAYSSVYDVTTIIFSVSAPFDLL